MVSVKHQSKNRLRLYDNQLSENSDVAVIEKLLLNIEDVVSVRINVKNKNLIIKHKNADCESIVKRVNELQLKEYKKADFYAKEQTPSKFPIALSASTLGLSLFVKNQPTMFALSSLAASPLLVEGTKELFKEGLTSKVLEASAVATSLVRGDYIAANSTNAMLSLGEYIEESSVHKSDELIKALAKPNVKSAWIEVTKNKKVTEVQVDASELKVGDIVIINSGDTIPVDGHVMSSEAMVNQVSMTGEAEPVRKVRGDKVMSGTVVEEGRLRVWAEQVGEDTATSRIRTYIQSSLDEKSSVGLKASKLADKLVPVTLGLAGVAYMINRDLESVASVLQADYSCALKLATPVAFKSAISQAGHEGILVKGAKSIEAMSEVDTVIFDKTGTLTYGKLEVVEVNTFSKQWSKQKILDLTASAEEHYFHPVAQAVVEAAKEKGFVHIHHEEVKFIVAHGVKTLVKGKEVVIGSRHFLEEDEGISFKSHESKIKSCINKGRTLLYIGYDKKLLGTISMVDNVRENAKAALKKLKDQGVKELVMLTGDVEEKAQMIAKEVGIDTVFAGLLPTDKAAKVKEYKKQGKKIAFVGDGINDAPALINADVGISMSKGADIAKATADISLLKDDIMSVANVKELSNKAMQRIDRHFKATVGINSGILLGATTGIFNPIATAVLHNGTTIGLLLSSMQKLRLNKAEI